MKQVWVNGRFFFPDSVEPDNAPRDFGPGMALTLEQRGFQIPVH